MLRSRLSTIKRDFASTCAQCTVRTGTCHAAHTPSCSTRCVVRGYSSRVLERARQPCSRSSLTARHRLYAGKERTQGDISEQDKVSNSTSLGKVVPLLATAAIAIAAVIYFKEGPSPNELLEDLEDVVASAGDLGPLVFVGAYVLWTLLLLPASLSTLAGGLLFGPWKGTVVVSLGSTIGAAACFLVSRYLAKPIVEDKLKEYPKFKSVVSAVSDQGAKVVLLLRLSPLFPFSLTNYGLGVTSVRFLPFVAASWLGMLPATAAYTYLGSLGKTAVQSLELVQSGSIDAPRIALLVVGAGATLLVVGFTAKVASNALEESQ